MKKYRINNNYSIREKELLKIKKKFNKTDLPHTKEALYKKHYKIQIANPIIRIISIAIGLFFFGLGIYFYDIIVLLIILKLIGFIFVVLGIRGRKKELNTILEISKDIVFELILDTILGKIFE